jgi:tetratricopeptide (TPR) repeat protein
MRIAKFRWVGYVGLAIWAWMAAAQASTAASADESSSAARGDGASTLQVLVPDRSSDEASEEPTAAVGQSSAESAASATSADEPDDEPVFAEDESSDGSRQEPAPLAKQSFDASPAPAEGALAPIPDPQHSDSAPVEVGVASFNGVTPGVTTASEVQQAWGPPQEIANRNAQLVQLYSVGPFNHVEVSLVQGRAAAIVIRLDRPFPAHLVAEKLELANIQPVLISNELGQILGQSYPERGVLFSFAPSAEPGRVSMQVAQIILEPVSAEPFVLRAETFMDSRPDSVIRDLDQALKLDPGHARAHWLRSRVLAVGGQLPDALHAAGEAVRLEPDDPQYRVTRAQILGQLGRFAEGIEEAESAVDSGTKRPHVQARALCLLGDLMSSGPRPDYRQALDYHAKAIQTADPLAVSRHPAIRLAAQEVLIDAHLGAANDIAWGPWDQKERAVPRWLERAATLADELVEAGSGSAEHQLRVATRALAACVGLRGQLDPTPWAEKTLEVGQQLLTATTEPVSQQRLRWDLGMALYDAVQIYQMRGQPDLALQCGDRAIGYLESGSVLAGSSLSESYLLGRLYFRLGAIHAVNKQDHPAAIPWFDKAVPVLEQAATQLDPAEWGRLGETFVSMAVSYWEGGQRDRALHLTEQGVELIREAVKAGSFQLTALEIPYSNLATMARQMGKDQQADQYLQQAQEVKKGTALR